MENVWRMSGESSFVMLGKAFRKLEKVWRKSGECLDKPNILQTFSRLSPTIKIWQVFLGRNSDPMMLGKESGKLDNVWIMFGKCLDNPNIIQTFPCWISAYLRSTVTSCHVGFGIAS